MLKDEPKLTKSSTEALLPNLENPYIDNECPDVLKDDLILIDEPCATKSRIESTDPVRTLP
jgi:hypothetical protein